MKSLTTYINEQRTDEGLLTGLAIAFGSVFALIMLALVECFYHWFRGEDDGGVAYSNWWESVRHEGLANGTLSWIFNHLEDLQDYITETREDRRYQKLKSQLEKDTRVLEFVKKPKKERRLKDIKEIIESYNNGYLGTLGIQVWHELRDFDNTTLKVQKEAEKDFAKDVE